MQQKQIPFINVVKKTLALLPMSEKYKTTETANGRVWGAKTNGKMKRFWLMFFLSAVLIGCMDRVDNRDLKICNNSSDTIYFFISQNDVFTYPYQDYSDKELNIKNSVMKDSCMYFIDRPIYWNGFFKDCEDGKMRLFIVAKDSVEKYGLRKILSKNIYTKVFKVDINELEKSKWQIIYE